MSYDPDAQSYITAVESADGQSLETGVKDAINSFVVGCKSDGIWTALKACCIMAGARTLNGALVPLVGAAPTNVNFVSSDYNRQTGLVGNGSTKYLNSNRNNNADPQNSRHLAVWRTTSETRSGTMNAIGTSGSGGSSSLLSTASNRFFRSADLAGSIVDTTTVSGFWGVSRSGASTKTGRYNSTNYNFTDSSSTPLSESVHVFARNAVNHSNARISWYSIGESLDLALLDARLSTLMTALANPATYGSPYRRNNFFISNMF